MSVPVSDDGRLTDAVTRLVRLNARRRRLEADEEALKREIGGLMEAMGVDKAESRVGTVTRQTVRSEEYDYRTLASILPPTLMQVVSRQVVDARMLGAMVARGDASAEGIAPSMRVKTYTRLIVEEKGKK